MKSTMKNQGENAKLSQSRGDDGDMTSCNVAPGTGAWEGKTTGREKVGKSE